MLTAAEIKHWLALVADARLALARALDGASKIAGTDEYDLRRAAEFLEDAYLTGLDAHGQAVLKEWLDTEAQTSVA